MSTERFVISMHITHKWVDIKEMEIFSTKEAKSLLHHIYRSPFVDEILFLKTCNRLEIYIATGQPEKVSGTIKGMIKHIGHGSVSEFFKVYGGEKTARQLFRVAAGIDSLVIGEDQILGQLKEALTFAQQEGTIGPTLTTLFEKAIKVGTKARIITDIGKGAVSVGSVAVDMAEKELGTLEDKKILVLGAGEMANLVSKALCSRNVKAVMVANRTYEAAKEMAVCLGGKAIQYTDLPQYGPETDVMICATSAPHIILTKKEIAAMRKGTDKKLLIIDISHPVNIDPKANELDGVNLVTMDGLRTIAKENKARRMQEIAKVEDLIGAELKVFLLKYKEKDAVLVVKQLHELGKDIRDKEIEKALHKVEDCQCDRSDKMREVMTDLSNSIISKLLAIPTLSLKAASRNGDMSTLDMASRLFNLKEKEMTGGLNSMEAHKGSTEDIVHEAPTKAKDEG